MALLFTCHDREIAYFFCPKGFFVIEFPKALHHQSLERASKGFIYLASCFCVKKCQSHTEFAQLTNFIATLIVSYIFTFVLFLYIRTFESFVKLIRSHITKEGNWQLAFINTLSNEVPQSQKRNASANHSQSATFGGSPAKQGRALTTSLLVKFV